MSHNRRLEAAKYQCRRERSYLLAKTVLGLYFMSGVVAGCAPYLQIRVGSRPNLQGIEQRLHVGLSTTDDVLAVLGPPQGKGYAMLPIDPKQRVMWSYAHFRGYMQTRGETRGDMRSLFLFVYFEQDLYTGYMWFSSLPD